MYVEPDIMYRYCHTGTPTVQVQYRTGTPYGTDGALFDVTLSCAGWLMVHTFFQHGDEGEKGRSSVSKSCHILSKFEIGMGS